MNEAQPSAADENAFLKTHSWDESPAWHLALKEGADDETKARYAFVYQGPPPRPPNGPDRLPLPGRGMAP